MAYKGLNSAQALSQGHQLKALEEYIPIIQIDAQLMEIEKILGINL